jgi:GTP cyclohydrolase II
MPASKVPASNSLLGLEQEIDTVTVDRALSELRSARPVMIRNGKTSALVLSAELVEPRLLGRLNRISNGLGRLVLSPARLRRIGSTSRKVAGIIALPELDINRIEQLALKVEAKMDAPIAPANTLDLAGLELAGLALIMPAVIVIPVKAEDFRREHLTTVDASAINAYRAKQISSMQIVGRAPVPLEGATDTEFVVFRGGEGLRDQVAIIVGKPDLTQPVPVRLHSACLTGDLFGSLKCDCGDQLRETVRWMADNEGGILLYLDQEGRGNGMSNKMKAYRLQSEGWDTYDADEVLGFDLDQRHFDFAAEMLKQLGVTRVTALTNNPIKIGAIRAAGLEVAASRRVLGRPNAHNVRYLASKRDKAGHYIDMDALLARAAPKD